MTYQNTTLVPHEQFFKCFIFHQPRIGMFEHSFRPEHVVRSGQKEQILGFYCRAVHLLTFPIHLHFTFLALKANIVVFLNMPKHEWIGVGSRMNWSDNHIWVIWHAANHTNVVCIAVSCSPEYQMVAPCAIFFHVWQVISPWGIPIDKVEQFCPIWLQEQ